MQQFIDSYDFAGKKAIVRVDFNVPLNEKFEITDDTRIRAAIPTLKKVLAGGGSLIIMSHLGRPKGVDAKFSLKHIIGRVSELLGVPVQFAEDCQKAKAQADAMTDAAMHTPAGPGLYVLGTLGFLLVLVDIRYDFP